MYDVCMSEARKGDWSLWNWSFRWLWAPQHLLGMGLASFGKVANALTCEPSVQAQTFLSPKESDWEAQVLGATVS